ncbi:hypothetical protein NDU88_004329 [Pleurodeles waltl]|uniref:Uncharacterized protein n=1 Tax=Pleurodeles waltl TaxID=8319 RepID=A0AAV7TTT1_PLEWA|nr:hypothetical protein NDU88_004329 [Pleurodeles waltl]
MGGPRPPGLHPQVSAQGGAAHLVPSSSAARQQGSAAGARSRPPRDSLWSFSLPRTSSAQLSAWPRPGRARRDCHLVFPPGIGPISARAQNAGSPVFFGVRYPRETQGHRGVRIGVFQLPWTVLIMGG